MRHSTRRSALIASSQRYDDDAMILFSAMTIAPSAERKALISSTITALKASGVWSKLDALWFMAAETEQAARLNWRHPGAHTLANINSPGFASDDGFSTYNSGGHCVDTTFVPHTDGVNFALDSASFGVYCATNTAASTDDMGAQDGSNSNVSAIAAGLVAPPPNINSYIRINQNDASYATAVASVGGFSCVQRNSSSAVELYKDGSSASTSSKNSSARPSYSMYIGARNSGGSALNVSTRRYTMAYIGAALSSDEHAAFYSAVMAYLTGVGAVEDTAAQAYFDVSSVADFYANVVTGAVLYLTNGSATATVKYRNFEAGTWYEALETSFTLGRNFAGTTTAIALISDVHFGYVGTDAAACLTSAINDIDDTITGVSHVCVLGDLCQDTDEYAAYLAVRATSDVPAANWHEIGGNHDYVVLPAMRAALSLPYPWHAFDVGNVTVLLMTPDANDRTLSQEQMAWITQRAEANSSRILLACTHQGRYSTTRSTTQATGYTLPDAIFNKLANIGVRAFFCGHSHGYTGEGTPGVTNIYVPS